MKGFKDGIVPAYARMAAGAALFIVKRGAIRAIRSAAYGLNQNPLMTFPRDELSKDAKAVSYLNTPVYSNLILGSGDSISTNYTDIEGSNLSYLGIEMDMVLMEISMGKNIIKTSIQGRNGTIKEYVSDSDYMINVSGRLSLKTSDYPESQVNRLIEICKVPDVIPVTSDFLTMFGINEVVIESYKIPQEKGFRNEQAFELSLLSNDPIVLEYVEA